MVKITLKINFLSYVLILLALFIKQCSILNSVSNNTLILDIKDISYLIGR